MTNNADMSTHEALKAQITMLEQELAALSANLPAHSLSPSMLVRLEDLERELENIQRELAQLSERLGPPPAE